jgi:hypothetical protein
MPSKLPEPSSGPSNSKSLRGVELRRLLKGWKFWAPTAVVLVGLFLYGRSQGAVTAVLLPVLGFGIALWSIWALARERSQSAFLEVYAKNRGLKVETVAIPSGATPLLSQGTNRGPTWTMAGQIAPGIDGALALFSYEEPTINSDGTPGMKDVYFTIGLVELPECATHVPELYCRRKSGLRSLEKLEDAFRAGKKRVTLESGALADRYEIFATENQDDVWLRRLFSPSFIVWLTESPPEKFAFELVGGTLVGYLPDRNEDIVSLDGLMAATGAVATRLREESAETTPPAVEPSKA